ncbi:MAG: hypothetical protein ABGY75_09825 [Gemmataceae bacterium]
MPVRVLIAVLMLAGATVARVCPCACGHAHPVEPAPAEDGGAQPGAPDHDPHCPCATGLAVDPAVVPQVEPLSDAPPALPDSPESPGLHTNPPRQQPDVRPPVGALPLYLTLLTLRN